MEGACAAAIITATGGRPRRWNKQSRQDFQDHIPAGLRDVYVQRGSTNTGGKEAFTQWVHGEFIVISEAICPLNTHWVHAEFFPKEPIKFLPLYPLGTG